MIVAIIDEDPEYREKIKGLLEERCFRMPSDSGFVLGYESFEEFLEGFSGENFEALVIDPGAPDRNGMEKIREIRKKNPKIPIIFYTDHQEYVFEGYTVGAFRYILKSWSESEKLLADVMELVLKAEEDKCLEVDMGGHLQSLFYRDIIFVECIRRTTYIHLISGKAIKIRNPIKEISETLCRDERFVECYRDIVANIAMVKEIKRQELVMTNGARIPVSRRRKAGFRRLMAEYMKNRGRSEEVIPLPPGEDES